MGRTSVAEVVVVDEKGAPIEGEDRLTKMRAELASGKRRTGDEEWNPRDNRYSARTNSKGIATVAELQGKGFAYLKVG